jgi:hypothetical protein
MIEYYKGSYKYVLACNLSHPTKIVNEGFKLPLCEIEPSGFLHVLIGYSWDGPSGPTIDTKSFIRGSLIHDALYQLLRETGFGKGHDKHDVRRYRADQILRNVCIEDGMWKWRAKWVFRGVRVGGGPAAAVKERAVFTAP